MIYLIRSELYISDTHDSLSLVLLSILSCPSPAEHRLSLADADWVHDFVLVPWADSVAVQAEESTLAAEEVGQVVLVHDLKQVLLVAASLDGNLLACLLVEEALNHGPHSREQ